MRIVAVAVLLLVGLQLTGVSPVGAQLEDHGYNLRIPAGLEEIDVWVGSEERLFTEPVKGRIISRFDLVDPSTGEITPITRSDPAPTVSGTTLVGCNYGSYSIFDLVTDSLQKRGGVPGLSSEPPNQCDERDGVVYSGDQEGLVVVNQANNRSELITYPLRAGRLRLFAGVGVEDRVLHVQNGPWFHDISLDDLHTLGPARPQRRKVDDQTGTYVDVRDGTLVELDEQGSVLRTVACFECTESETAFVLDSDRVVVTGEYLRIANLATGLTEARIRGSYGPVVHIDDQNLYLNGRTSLRVLPRSASYITDGPTDVDFRRDDTATFQTWSLSEPVEVRANGISIPFESVEAGVSVGTDSLPNGSVGLVVEFADGSVTDPVNIDVIAASAFRTITITSYGERLGWHQSQVVMHCVDGEREFDYLPQWIAMGEQIQFTIPTSATCSARASGGRFGPLDGDGRVIDYTPVWPDPALTEDAGDEWALYMGEDVGHPVHWILATNVGDFPGRRTVTLSCGNQRWQRDVAYGDLIRVVHDSASANDLSVDCRWSAPAALAFENTEFSTFGRTIVPPVGRGIRDTSTFTILTDIRSHPDNDATSFVNTLTMQMNGRQASERELERWRGPLDSDPDARGRFVDALVRSEEYRKRADSMARLYQTYFDRLPDAGGLAYWVDVVESGTGRLAVSRYFAQSEEFRLRYGDSGDRLFVALAYRNVLNREPDASGYEYWLDTMDTGGLEGPDVLFYFSEGQEFKTSMRSRVDVSATYNLLTGRSPSEAELRSGIASYEATGGLADLANSLLDGADYRAHFAGYQRSR